MREIKFRAWDTDSKIMLYEGWTGKPQFFVNMGVWQFTDKDKLSPLHIMDKKANLHPMQYTGLKDKNGVEIYEGDIVQVPERLHMDEGGVVEYSHTGQYVMAQGSFKTSIHEMVYNKWKLEVIGNIYENSDLLAPKHNQASQLAEGV